jgi:hypothetical protein
MVTDVSKDRSAFIFRVQQSKTKVGNIFPDTFVLNMELLSFETSVTIYQPTRRNSAEDFNLQQLYTNLYSLVPLAPPGNGNTIPLSSNESHVAVQFNVMPRGAIKSFGLMYAL